MKKIRSYVLMLGFASILFMPALLKNISPRFGLSGVTEAAEFPALTKAGLLDGSFQEQANTYYADHMPGRDLMIKLRNQMIVSLYGKSPNKNVVIGYNDNLFELEYILKYEMVYPSVTEEYTRDLCDKLTVIRDKLEQQGKEFYLFITPTKVRYYEDDVPEVYKKAASFRDMQGNYEMFTSILQEYDFKVYDSIPFINEYEKTAEVPLYYKTGSHWSWVTSTYVTADLVRFLKEHSNYEFPDTEVVYSPVAVPLHPDADIFNTFNIFTKPYDTYYTADLLCSEMETPLEQRPNLFCRGGSFMGQTITYLIRKQMFYGDTYIENTQEMKQNFSSVTSFSDYEELDIAGELEAADIVIFEVNESHIPVMSFGLIDYLTEHPEILGE